MRVFAGRLRCAVSTETAFWSVASIIGTLAAVLLFVKGRELFARMPKASLHRWTVDLQADAEALIRAELHVAECHMVIAERIGKMPPDFVAPAFLASRVGYAVERAVVEEAKRRGIWSPETLTDLGKPDAMQGQDEAPPSERVSVAPVFSAAPGRATEWREGKLVPMRRKT